MRPSIATVRAPADPREVVVREGRTGRLAAVAAGLSIVLTLGAIAVSSQRPTGSVGTAAEDQVRLLGLLHDDPGAQWTSFALRALSLLLLVGVGWFLARAVADRDGRPQTTAKVLAVAGPLALVASLLAGLLIAAHAADVFASGPRTPERAEDVFGHSAGVRIIGVVEILSHIVFAAWVVLASLTMLRVGLLSRTLAYWGMIAGVAAVMLSIGDTLFTGWLGAVAALAWGWWPGAGRPPAWTSGTAEPWDERLVRRAEREST